MPINMSEQESNKTYIYSDELLAMDRYCFVH